MVPEQYSADERVWQAIAGLFRPHPVVGVPIVGYPRLRHWTRRLPLQIPFLERIHTTEQTVLRRLHHPLAIRAAHDAHRPGADVLLALLRGVILLQRTALELSAQLPAFCVLRGANGQAGQAYL